MGTAKKGELTPRQHELLRLIMAHQNEFNTLPTLVELAAKMGITISGVAQKISALQRKGIIERRNIYLIKI